MNQEDLRALAEQLRCVADALERMVEGCKPLDIKPVKRSKPLWTGGMQNFPERLRTTPFLEAWKLWIDYRSRELRKPVTQRSGDLALAELEMLGPERAIAAIRYTIARGWQGIRQPEPGQAPTPQSSRPAQRCSSCGSAGGSLVNSQYGALCTSCYNK